MSIRPPNLVGWKEPGESGFVTCTWASDGRPYATGYKLVRLAPGATLNFVTPDEAFLEERPCGHDTLVPEGWYGLLWHDFEAVPAPGSEVEVTIWDSFDGELTCSAVAGDLQLYFDDFPDQAAAVRKAVEVLAARSIHVDPSRVVVHDVCPTDSATTS